MPPTSVPSADFHVTSASSPSAKFSTCGFGLVRRTHDDLFGTWSTDVAVEVLAELRQRTAGHRTQIQLRLPHELEIVRRAEGDPLAVRRKTRRALGDVGVAGEALDIAGRDVEEIDVRIVAFLGDAAHVAVVLR